MAGQDGSETQVAKAEPVIIAKHPVAESLRTELLKLATDGDAQHKGALTAEVLARIMRVAKTGRDLLVSLNISGSNLSHMVRRPRGGMGYLATANSFAGDEDMGDEGQNSGGPFAYSSPQENFGMTALRELIAGVKGINGSTSPAKLVEALAIAREKGLTDVAKDLETQLGMTKAVPVVAVPTPADGKGAQP